MGKKKSLTINALLSSLKTLTTILFPLITYPYITRVLSVDSIGKINFGHSIVSYFTLLAGLGISTFAVRNGSQIRNDVVKFNEFANRVFSINVISTCLSSFFLVILVFLPTKISDYRSIILIQGIVVALSPLAVDWIYTINEDFGYITLRSFCVHLLSLILMFVFVKKEEDVYLYVALTTMSTSLGNLFNFYHSRRYVRLKFTKNTNWSEYKQSIMIFFVNSIATTIYLNSDVTLLGILCNDRAVGLYSVATKIYSIVKQMFNAVVASTIPRLAFLRKNNETEFEMLLKKIISIAVFFIAPAVFGMILLRKEIVILISGRKYLEAANTLSILAGAIFFAVIANILANGLLICMGREKHVLKATIMSAITNVVLNFFFIPKLSQDGAAITTLIAEAMVVCVAFWYGRDYVKKVLDLKQLSRTIVASALMYAISLVIWSKIGLESFLWIRIFGIMITGIITYGGIMVIIKDEIMFEMYGFIKQKIIKRIK